MNHEKLQEAAEVDASGGFQDHRGFLPAGGNRHGRRIRDRPTGVVMVWGRCKGSRDAFLTHESFVAGGHWGSPATNTKSSNPSKATPPTPHVRFAIPEVLYKEERHRLVEAGPQASSDVTVDLVKVGPSERRKGA